MGLKKLYIGSIFLLTFAVANFNIFPNLIAYVFFLWGLNQLNSEYGGFNKAILATVICFPLGIIDFIRDYTKIDILSLRSNEIFLNIFSGLDFILVIMMVILTLDRLKQIYESAKDDELLNNCIKVRKKFLIFNLVVLAFLPLPLVIPNSISLNDSVFSWLMLIPALAFLIMYLNVYSGLIYHFSEADKKLSCK